MGRDGVRLRIIGFLVGVSVDIIFIPWFSVSFVFTWTRKDR
jgi:hypothetical protein